MTKKTEIWMHPEQESENGMGESYVPLRALTLATRSWNPWPHKLGTSSSTISIFLPSKPGLSYSWSL